MENLRFEIVPSPDVPELVSRRLPPGAGLTVCCLPKHGLDQTLETAERLADRGYTVIPHLPARAIPSRSFLRSALARLARPGLGRVLVMGGDGLQDGPYAESLHLMEDVWELRGGSVEIGIVGYPEGHPHASQVYDALLRKQRLAAHLTTQICFDAAILRRYLQRLRRDGVDLPVWVGVPGAVGREQLAKASSRLGVGVSSRKVNRFGPLSRKLFRDGNFDVERFLKGAGPGFEGAHISTFNRFADLPQTMTALEPIGAPR